MGFDSSLSSADLVRYCADHTALCWCRFDNEMVVRDGRFGRTHLLSFFAAETLAVLLAARSACTVDEIGRSILRNQAELNATRPELSTGERAKVASIVGELVRLGLVATSSA
jgi:hypothetical protein